MKALLAFGMLLIAWSASAVPLQLLSQVEPSTAPSASAGGDSFLPVVSPDGRFVLFASTANNLALAATNRPYRAPLNSSLNVFLADRASNTVVLLSPDLTGAAGADADATPIGLSTNGQFALFESAADNLVAGDTNGTTDVFVRDAINGATILVSVNTNGLSGNGASDSSVMTPDGRYVAFSSAATNLVAGDTNGIPDVFLRDLKNGTTRLVSVGAKATSLTAFTNLSAAEAITPDGRYVAFYSSATNLVAGQRLAGDIYVRDMVAGTTTWASSGARDQFKAVTGSTNAVSCNARLSDDGQYVAFEACTNPATATSARGIILRYNVASGQTDLVHTNAYVPLTSYDIIQDLDMTADGRFVAFVANINGSSGLNTAIYLWDALSGTSTLVSANTNNALPAQAFCDQPKVSANGQYVAFFGDAPELATNAVGNGTHLFLRDLSAGITALVNADTNGVSSADASLMSSAMTSDGQFVAFESAQPSLAANDVNRCSDVFLRHCAAGTTELISARQSMLPSLTGNGPSTFSTAAISQDGRYVTFLSLADNLTANDTNQTWDVFVRDLFTGTNVLVSRGAGGAIGNYNSFDPAISGNGRYVAFASAATNLVASDGNNATDVFVNDLQSQSISLVSAIVTGMAGGNQDSYSPVISADGRFVLFISKASNLTAGSFSGTDNLFLRDPQMSVTYALTTTGQAYASMTPDGHFVAYTDTAGSSAGRIYLWDSQLGKRIATNSTATAIRAISISPNGSYIAYFTGSGSTTLSIWSRPTQQVLSIASGYISSHAGLRFSADGSCLTYAAGALSAKTNQVYLFSIPGQTNLLVSHGAGLVTAADDNSDSPDISADGRYVAYRSAADNIVPGDTNGVPDVFLFDAATGTNTILSAGASGNVAADNRSLAPIFSGDGHTLIFRSWGTDLTPADFNQTSDLFAFAFLYLRLATASDGSPILNWPASSEQTFSVEYKDDLTDSVWHAAPNPVTIIGNRGYSTDGVSASGHRFYRVVANH